MQSTPPTAIHRPKAPWPPALMLFSLALAVGASACGTAPAPTPARPVVDSPRAVALPPVQAPHTPAPEVRATTLYTPAEALRDALASPLEYIGTGRWPGIRRAHACAFRNDRVLVVNVYCTLSDIHAFRVDIYSEARGRVRVYAETNGPISARDRRLYFTFTSESEPPPEPKAGLPQVALSMPFDALRGYDEQRYEAFLPLCFGGINMSEPQNGCLGDLAPQSDAWAAQNRDFIAHANGDWYQLVKLMRSLSARYGRALE